MSKMTESTISLALAPYYSIDGHLKTTQVLWPHFANRDQRMNPPTSRLDWNEPSQGKKNPEGPQKSFFSKVQGWMDLNKHFSEKDIVQTVQDQAHWRRLTVNCL